MILEGGARPTLPDSVSSTLDEFHTRLDLDIHVWSMNDGGASLHLYPAENAENGGEHQGIHEDSLRLPIVPKDGPPLELEIRSPVGAFTEAIGSLLQSSLVRTLDLAREIRFFTDEVSERYEEINLLYSISETLGSVLKLDEAADAILREVCDVLGAERGSLWVHDAQRDLLHLTACVGKDGLDGPLCPDDPEAVTSRVFREGRPLLDAQPDDDYPVPGSSHSLSVPINYSPPVGEPRTVGVINLFGRRHGGRFTASDQKLLSSIASQIGAALENNRLIQESLAQERMSHEMELAANLQMKLLKSPESFDRAEVAARVVPAEQVGGDFFHVFKLPEDKIGVMIGDVSTHGFPAALIMALSMSASSIYALEAAGPCEVLRKLDDALRDELETTEMFLSLCYVVIDPSAKELRYSNAGHPHAFVFRRDGGHERLTATDPPVGFAGPDAFGEECISWQDGDLLLLFTDGLPDTLATTERGSGERVVLDAVAAQGDAAPARIVEILFELAEGATANIPADDRTVIALRT